MATPDESLASRTSESSFVGAVKAWSGFQFDQLRAEMDEQVLAVADSSEMHKQKRKKLASQTKTFRVAEDEEKLRSIRALVTSYQEEIDSLTRRADYAERSLVSIHKKIEGVPDPSPFLEKGLGFFQDGVKQVQKDLESVQLRREVEEARGLSASLRAAEAKVERLEEELLSKDAKLESQISSHVAVREAALGEQLAQSQERESRMQKALNSVEAMLQQVRRQHAQAVDELFQVKARNEELAAARQGESDVLDEELERSAARIQSLERELDEARQSAGSFAEAVQKADRAMEAVSSLEAEIAVKESLLGAAKLEAKKYGHIAEGKSAELDDLTAELDSEVEKRKKMELEMRNRPSMEEFQRIRKQLAILQGVEFNVQFDNALAEETPDANLDSILSSKIRSLQARITELEVTSSTWSERCVAAEERVVLLEAQDTQQRKLISRLEDDVMNASSAPTVMSGSLDKGLSWVANSKELEGPRLENGQNEEEAKRSASALQIVSKQRDRFRERMEQFEDLVKQKEVELKAVVGDVERLTDDNVKLYEKIRFLQSYPDQGIRDRESVPMRSPKLGTPSKEIRSASEVEGRYSKLYEETVNPFRAFTTRERTRRYKSLSPADRLALSTGTWLMHHRHARTFLLLYSFVLHILIFIMLYWRSTCAVSASDVDQLEQKGLAAPALK